MTNATVLTATAELEELHGFPLCAAPPARPHRVGTSVAKPTTL
jgi:hypothetical protein